MIRSKMEEKRPYNYEEKENIFHTGADAEWVYLLQLQVDRLDPGLQPALRLGLGIYEDGPCKKKYYFCLVNHPLEKQ